MENNKKEFSSSSLTQQPQTPPNTKQTTSTKLDQHYASKINFLNSSLHHKPREKRCCNCRIGEIGGFGHMEQILIELQNQQYYCEKCLREIYKEQKLRMKKQEERYIYQMQMESSKSWQRAEKSLKTGQSSQQTIEKSILQLEKQQQQIDIKIHEIKKSCNELFEAVNLHEQKQQDFWSNMNAFEKRAYKLELKQFEAGYKKEKEAFTFKQLQKSSIILKFFDIQIQNKYAKVSGMVIGKTPDSNVVNWEDTNSGLAHLLLAFNYISLKYNVRYSNIKEIKIKGTLSNILLNDSPNYYSICYTEKNQASFGKVMDTFLLALKDIDTVISSLTNNNDLISMKLPFEIDVSDKKIGGMAINPEKMQEKWRWDTWTKSMRYFLINFKHLLVISSLCDPFL